MSLTPLVWNDPQTAQPIASAGNSNSYDVLLPDLTLGQPPVQILPAAPNNMRRIVRFRAQGASIILLDSPHTQMSTITGVQYWSNGFRVTSSTVFEYTGAAALWAGANAGTARITMMIESEQP